MSDYTQQLRSLMQKAGFTSFQALSRQAKVSRRQLTHLRQGQIQQLSLETLLNLAQTLQVSLEDLLVMFAEPVPVVKFSAKEPASNAAIATLQQEYQRLQTQLQQQQQLLWQEFQAATLQSLESLLLQWPTAAYAAENNPQAPAVKLLPLLRPIQQLLQEWQIETIGPVGTEVDYDPQCHQLIGGTAEPGDRVKIRYVGYRQGEKLLYRAKVSQSQG